MSILTEEEIEAIRESTCQEFMAALREQGSGKYDPPTFSRAIESAVLAKLATMELPKPCGGDFLAEGHYYYTAAQLHQAFAQGAAQVFEQQASEIERLRVALIRISKSTDMGAITGFDAKQCENLREFIKKEIDQCKS